MPKKAYPHCSKGFSKRVKYGQALWRTTLSFFVFKGYRTSVLSKYVDLIYALFKFLKSCAQHAEFKETISSGEDFFLLALLRGALSFLLIKRASLYSLFKVATTDMRYFARSKFSGILVQKKHFSLISQVVLKLGYVVCQEK